MILQINKTVYLKLFFFFFFFFVLIKVYDVCVNQGLVDKGTCLKSFKQRLSDNFMQDWKGRTAFPFKQNLISKMAE